MQIWKNENAVEMNEAKRRLQKGRSAPSDRALAHAFGRKRHNLARVPWPCKMCGKGHLFAAPVTPETPLGGQTFRQAASW